MKVALLYVVVMAYLLADSTTAQGSTFEFKCGVEELKEDFISRMDNVEGKLNSVEGKLDNVEGNLNNVEGKLDSVEGKLEGKLDELQVQHQDLQGKIDRMATVVDGKLDDLKQLLEKVITSQSQPVDGGWTQGGTWSACGSNCENTRGRTCSNPAPSNGGSSCTGESDEKEICTGGSCKGEKLYASDGYSFFKTPVPYGTSMKNPAVSKTCIGAGMKSACSFPKGCAYNSGSCRMTPLSTSGCGGWLMHPLSRLICNGKQADKCPQLEGMFSDFKHPTHGNRGIVGGKVVWAQIKADVYHVSKKETPYFAYCVL
eukprot:GFUD01099225.1.p1 GENE.GFUD01099225.1~~GFUD01099225.1.p1  ORF type:complete len:314 (+),score=82.47 GFUD01099225.1:97-1038(+)